MNFEDDADEETGFIDKSEVGKQGRKIKGALKKGYDTNDLAKNAMLKLRGQRDQMIDTLGMLREMGTDLVRTENVTKELTMRKFVSLLILYLLAFVLMCAIVLISYYKLFKR